MKKMRRGTMLTAAVLTLALTLGLSACGGESAAPATPEEVLAKAQEAMDGVKSMGYDMTMEMSLGVEGVEQTMNISSVTSAEAIQSPLTMKAEVTTDMGDVLGESLTMTMYVKEENGSYMTAIGTADDSGAVTWENMTMDSLDELANLDGKASMDLYLSSGSGFTEGATEQVGDVEATRYDGTIPGAKLEEVLETSGVLTQMESLGLGDATTMFSGLGDLPMSIWVAKDTYYPVKYEMDMSEMMQSILEKVLSEQAGMDVGLTVEKMNVSMVMRDFNAIETIDIPAEAFA